MIQLEREELEKEQRESRKAETQIQLLIKDLEDSLDRNKTLKEDLVHDLEELERDIETKETQLNDDILPKYQDLLTREGEAKRSLEISETKQRTLFDKQGRSKQFRTQKERDAHLRAQIATSTTYLQNREDALVTTNVDIEHVQTMIQGNRTRQAEVNDQSEKRKEDVLKLSRALEDLTSKRDERNEERKQLWQQAAGVEQRVSQARAARDKAQRMMYQTMDRVS